MPTVPGYADVSVELSHSLSTRPAFITFGIDPTDTDPSLMAADVFNSLTASGSITKRMDSQVTLTAIRISYGTDGSADLVYVARYAEACTGITTALQLPGAVLVHKITARGGRRGRGRMYIPWYVTGTQVGETGIISSAELALVQASINVFRSALATNGVPMVVLHGPGNTSMGAPDVVTLTNVDALIGVQRRRLGR